MKSKSDIISSIVVIAIIVAFVFLNIWSEQQPEKPHEYTEEEIKKMIDKMYEDHEVVIDYYENKLYSINEITWDQEEIIGQLIYYVETGYDEYDEDNDRYIYNSETLGNIYDLLDELSEKNETINSTSRTPYN